MTLADTSRLLIFLAACDWILTAVIYMSARRLREPALTERAAASIILSTVATGGALLGANVLGWLVLPRDVTTLILVAAFVLVSAPQFIWAIGLATGRFR